MNRFARLAWITLAVFAVASGCNKLYTGTPAVVPTTSPTGTPTTSPSPAPCNTISPSTSTVIVDVASSIAATTSAYGSIFGYAVDPGTGNLPTQAAVLGATASGSNITPANTVQFTNTELYSYSPHSAVGFKGNAFPATPYAFPSPAASPQGTTISSSTLWSTGRIQSLAAAGMECFSQAFRVTPGTYYFGDLDQYNLTNFRDVLVVKSGALKKTSRR